MDTIIAQSASEVVGKIVKYIAEKGISSVGETAEGLMEILKEGALEILAQTIQVVDEAMLRAKKDRKADGLTVKARNVERVYITEIGELRYRRTYYQCSDKTKIYPVDHLIGVEPFERISKEFCAKLVGNAASCSMAKAAEAYGGTVSRQSVNNKILAMKDVVSDISRVEETPEELHLFADEDHVHMRPKGSVMVPLVTVTEGIDTTNEKRHKTIRATHFQGYGVSNEAFVENVMAAIYERYDVEKIRNIYIHADGGNWIRRLTELLPNAVPVMDGFHAERQLKTLLGLKDAACYANALRLALKKNDRDAFLRHCESLLQRQDKEESQKKLVELAVYFNNNWRSVAERYSGRHCGSCTEPLVGHMLSERLSRNPLAWSKEGLAKMAMLRVYVKNGNTVKAGHIRISRNKAERNRDFKTRKCGLEKYNGYAEKQIREFFSGKYDWSVFESSSQLPGLTNGKLTGTAVILQTLSHLPACAS